MEIGAGEDGDVKISFQLLHTATDLAGIGLRYVRNDYLKGGIP